MSHEDFIRGYTNGRFGCSVSSLLTLRLFLVGRIRKRPVVICLVNWALGLLFVVGLSIVGFLCLSEFWTLLGTIISLAIFALGFVHQVGTLIVSTALIDVHFYQFALAERALCVSSDGMGNTAWAAESIIRLVVDPGQSKVGESFETVRKSASSDGTIGSLPTGDPP
jgi:hypothetical protein